MEYINELENKQFTITAEAKTVYRVLLAMLTHLTAYLKKVDNFACYAQHEKQKANVLNALRQAEPIVEPLNGYLEQLVWCLQQAEDNFRIFKDYCDDKLSTVLEGYKSTADECEAIARRASMHEPSRLAHVAALTIGVPPITVQIGLELAVNTVVFGPGVWGLAAETVFGHGVWGLAATKFKDKKKPLILIAIGEIEETASSVQRTAGKVQAELKEITEQIKDIRFFMSNQASLMESIENLFDELGNFATITSKCLKEVSLKHQDLENFIFKVIGIS